MGVRLIGVANKTQLLQRSWTLPNDSKHNLASFMTISIDSLRLRVAQTPISRDLANFVLTTDRQTNRLLYPLLRMRTRGNYVILKLKSKPPSLKPCLGEPFYSSRFLSYGMSPSCWLAKWHV
jgi:hypothetical protein